MKVFLLLILAGFATVLTLPPSWQGGALLGWTVSCLIETILILRRPRTLEKDSPQSSFLGLLVLGFLARLLFIGLGALLAHQTQLFHTTAFLLSFLAGMFCGEASSLPKLLNRPKT
ncbi:MAG: hypothetical protein QGH51_00810 [Planctomycetota bacterium]|nr:hypothetical protein [Planctomycetota bacterium]MDP6940542.1 hypothetical protein [Planctomycetota bacterium]